MVNSSILLRDLHAITGIEESLLNRFCEADGYTYYRHAVIVKNSGKPRHIFIPTAELKTVQYAIKDRFLSKLPISQYSTAYAKGSSVLKNAQVHQENSHFLFLDIRHFFDSIPFARLCQKLEKQWQTETIQNEDIIRLLKIYTQKKVFVQGCVTSPILSNFYLLDFDNRVANIIATLPNGKYSRYSDDIIISSSERIPDGVVSKVDALLQDEGLSLNAEKQRFVSAMDRTFITGVHLTADRRFVLSTKYKKQIKKEIYNFINSQNKTSSAKQKLVGLLGYLKMVDPHYYYILEDKYAQNGIPFSKYLRLTQTKS